MIMRTLVLAVMMPEDADAISRPHLNSPHLTPDALRYEYHEDPHDWVNLYFGKDDDGAALASQGFVGQTLIKDGVVSRTPMGEQALLCPRLQGKANFTQFYLDAQPLQNCRLPTCR